MDIFSFKRYLLERLALSMEFDMTIPEALDIIKQDLGNEYDKKHHTYKQMIETMKDEFNKHQKVHTTLQVAPTLFGSFEVGLMQKAESGGPFKIIKAFRVLSELK